MITNENLKAILSKARENHLKTFGSYGLSLEALDKMLETVDRQEKLNRAIDVCKDEGKGFGAEYEAGWNDCLEKLEQLSK